MQHANNNFSRPPVQEWLIYFKRSFKTFSIWIIGDDKEYKVDGQYCYSGNVNVSLKMNAMGNVIGLDLKTDVNSSWNRRLFGTAPLVGFVILDGNQIGSCIVQNSHQEGISVIHVENRKPIYQLDAHWTETGWVAFPLLVFGIENCEMILEYYQMMDKGRRQQLPNNNHKKYFVGSCRSTHFTEDPISGVVPGISLVVAVSELIVKEYYM
jgi:hypothetical protein